MMVIVHAFSELMNLYGEYANVDVLAHTLAQAGEEVEVVRLSRLEGFDPEHCDFLFIGAGTESATVAACSEAVEQREKLVRYIAQGGIALLCGNAPAVLGMGIEKDGSLVKGAGILDITYTVVPGKRYYTELLAECAEITVPVVGSINTSCRVKSGEASWFDVCVDTAGFLNTSVEGARRGNVFATSMTGPLLVRNPALCGRFAEMIAGREISFEDAPWQQYLQRGYDSVVQTLKKGTERA